MNLKKLYLSTAILAVLAVITHFVKNADDSSPTDKRIGRNPLFTLSLPQVTKIQLQLDGDTKTLAQNEDNTGWIVEEQQGLPANIGTINDFITQLRESYIERVATSNPDRIAELGFGDETITFYSDSQEPLLTLELGRQTDNGKQLIKYGDEDRAFIVNAQYNPPSAPTAWLDKSLLEFQRDDIRSATFTFPDAAPLTVSRESADAEWTADSALPEGKELDPGALNRALNRFASINFTDIASQDDPDAIAAKDHERSLSLSLADGPSYTITLGQRPEVKVTKEVETTNDDGETVTEEQEVVETPAGPVFITIASDRSDDPINGYMQRAAYKVGSFLLNNLPQTPAELLRDTPEPEPATDDTEAAPQE